MKMAIAITHGAVHRIKLNYSLALIVRLFHFQTHYARQTAE